jgi:hypothetical protein
MKGNKKYFLQNKITHPEETLIYPFAARLVC